jgi:hypothetical protein
VLSKAVPVQKCFAMKKGKGTGGTAPPICNINIIIIIIIIVIIGSTALGGPWPPIEVS